MPQAEPAVIIVTDLDGTLLDFDTYRCDPALPLVDRLITSGIPVIPCSSKTHAEITFFLSSAGLPPLPHIAENGAVIAIPRDPVAAGEDERYELILAAQRRTDIQRALADIRARLRLSLAGFQQLTSAQLQDLTGLPLSLLELAQHRLASEPIILNAEDRARVSELKAALARHGLQCLEGNRFYHVFAADVDKAKAVTRLRRRLWPQAPTATLVALGDSPNDAALLKRADIAVIIPHKRTGRPHPQLIKAVPTARIAPAPGPDGWAVAMTEILQECKLPLSSTSA